MVPDRDADGITVMAHDNQVRSSAAAAAAAAAAVAAAAAPLPSSLLEDGVRFENNSGSSSSGSSSSGSSSSNNRNNRGGGGGGGGGRGEEAEELLQPQKQQQHWQQQASFRHVSSSPMPLTPPLRRRRPESTKGKRRRQQPETKDGEGRTPLTRKGVLLWTCYASGLLMACVFLFAWLRTIAMAKVVFSEGRSGTGGIVVDAGFGETDSWAAAAAAGRSPSFTVLVNTFQRPKQLAEAVRHYAACEGVESVRVVWSEQSPPPDPVTSPALFDHPKPVRIQRNPTTSINNRFIPPSDLSTEAVFVVDDDISVPCEHLLAAFGTWRRHPDTLVGFFPRSHSHTQQNPKHNQLRGQQEEVERGNEGEGGGVGGVWEYLYFWRVLWTMEYSIVLTKAAFVHSKYLELYSGVSSEGGGGGGEEARTGELRKPLWSEGMAEAMAKTRAYVDDHRNCEDIAMQMAVTSVSGLPPVAVFAPVVDIGLFGGISTGEGGGKWWKAPHAKTRSRCLEDLHEIMCAGTTAAAQESSSCESLIKTDLAPTLAEFVSGDMLLGPAKFWRWLAVDDAFGRTPVEKEGGEERGGEGGQKERGAIAGGGK
eukprot:jgi/Undpi1/13345/HiC_scaffold_8.g03004.m1